MHGWRVRAHVSVWTTLAAITLWQRRRRRDGPAGVRATVVRCGTGPEPCLGNGRVWLRFVTGYWAPVDAVTCR